MSVPNQEGRLGSGLEFVDLVNALRYHIGQEGDEHPEVHAFVFVRIRSRDASTCPIWPATRSKSSPRTSLVILFGVPFFLGINERFKWSQIQNRLLVYSIMAIRFYGI